MIIRSNKDAKKKCTQHILHTQTNPVESIIFSKYNNNTIY